MTAATVNGTTFELRNAANALVTATVSYDATTRTATLTPGAALAAGATYTATVRGGATDPRVKDAAGNALAAQRRWSFTTGSGTGGCTRAAESDRRGELPGRQSRRASGTSPAVGDPEHPGLRDRHQRQPRQHRLLQGQTPTRRPTASTSTAWATTAAQGARKVATVTPSATPAAEPAELPQRRDDRSDRLRQLGRVRLVGGARRPRPRASTSPRSSAPTPAARATSSSSCATTRARRRCCSRPSDTTWQAYNSYGGNSLYTGSPAGRAYKVSYNRPFNTRVVDDGQDWVFNAEYPMVRWLEANGYDVSYIDRCRQRSRAAP